MDLIGDTNKENSRVPPLCADKTPSHPAPILFHNKIPPSLSHRALLGPSVIKHRVTINNMEKNKKNVDDSNNTPPHAVLRDTYPRYKYTENFNASTTTL